MNHDLVDRNPRRRLPPYRGLFAVDCVQFSKNRSVNLPDLSAKIPYVLETALTRCGIPQVWERRRFPQGTGDGYIFGMKTKHIPTLIDQVLPSLQDVLYELAPGFRAQERSLNLRLRASIHIGPVYDQGDVLRDRISEPTVYACRLLDSTPLRDALKRSEPDVTLIGAIISQRVFEDVIRSGYTELHETEFEHVTAEVTDKDFAQAAWLYIPRRSRHTGRADPAEEPVAAEKSTPLPTATAIFHGNIGQNITASQISDGVHLNLPDGFLDSRRKKEQEES
ncbi:hypothetical protein [Streptosporangium sp. NBC_01756]|uniref:hypothetical protein n=1 Tax=Streptosporangium sp. NBC_01756 TaxID=2975950 RepID=UPI002DD8DE00|nr:hypothetical protein [Streptosporangium sp. NBC_01756]WSC88248.1 hypothetical protein OIE48_08700 [Streptosporangium sp. NBC_01756]